jgi:hypothetical protein
MLLNRKPFAEQLDMTAFWGGACAFTHDRDTIDLVSGLENLSLGMHLVIVEPGPGRLIH